MADKTGISWTSATWNPVTGCDRVSDGCDHCYALTLAARLKEMGSPKYQADGDPRTSGPGFGVTVHPDVLDQPLRWTKPRRIFVNSMSDLFHKDVPDEFIRRVWSVMARAPQHTYQVLTKRHARMRSWLSEQQPAVHDDDPVFVHSPYAPLRNVWVGVSVEDQKWADIRIPALLNTPAAVRFLSCEPLLGPVSLTEECELTLAFEERGPVEKAGYPIDGIDWVIVGGESGPGARPMHPAWARQLRDECAAAGVPFFMKQFGAWRPLRNGEYPPPGETRTLHERGARTDPILVRHGGHNADPEQWPADIRIQQFPAVLEAVTP